MVKCCLALVDASGSMSKLLAPWRNQAKGLPETITN